MVRNTTVADGLAEAASGYLLKKGYSVHREFGLVAWGRLRADVIAINLRCQIVICEVKSSVADFRSDRKWAKYLDFCDQFFFVFTDPVWSKVKGEFASLDKRVGVLVLDPEVGFLVSKRQARRNVSRVPVKDIVVRMAWRGGVSKRNSRRKRIFLD